jgi:hypothetical protein
MRTGEHSGYKWIESELCDLHDVLAAVPEIVAGHCAAIASFDSGTLEATQAESARGWIYALGVTYIPHVREVSELPYDHYDEWYVLDTRRPVGSLETFVNYLGFGLSDPEQRGGERDATWDAVGWRYYADAERERQTLFWAQVARVQPESCILNGELFVLATRNLSVFEAVVRCFAKARA